MPRSRTIALLIAAAAALTGAAPAHALEVGTHNLHEGDARVQGFAPVIGWQEAEVAQTPGVMAKLRAIPGYKTFFPAGDGKKRFSANAVPISWQRSTFTLLAKGAKLTHGGEAHVTPSRWVTWVVLRNTNTQKSFVFVNTHFISKAYTGHPERRARWDAHLAVLRERVAALATQYAAPVVVVGDFNRPAYSPLPGLTPVRTPSKRPSYDQIYATTGLNTDPAVRLPLWGSDHHAFRATVKLP
jgi:hypothetical protein